LNQIYFDFDSECKFFFQIQTLFTTYQQQISITI